MTDFLLIFLYSFVLFLDLLTFIGYSYMWQTRMMTFPIQQEPFGVENFDEDAKNEHVDTIHDWDYQEDKILEVTKNEFHLNNLSTSTPNVRTIDSFRDDHVIVDANYMMSILFKFDENHTNKTLFIHQVSDGKDCLAHLKENPNHHPEFLIKNAIAMYHVSLLQLYLFVCVSICCFGILIRLICKHPMFFLFSSAWFAHILLVSLVMFTIIISTFHQLVVSILYIGTISHFFKKLRVNGDFNLPLLWHNFYAYQQHNNNNSNNNKAFYPKQQNSVDSDLIISFCLNYRKKVDSGIVVLILLISKYS
ncbi:hypothetical protein ACJX0J_040061, partial [Zea mays]